jgi:hypothetical protein
VILLLDKLPRREAYAAAGVAPEALLGDVMPEQAHHADA